MPSKKPETPKEPVELMLRIGKYNNIVQWLEVMKTEVGATYGATARFLTTNVRFVHRIPTEADYLPAFPVVIEGQPPAAPLTAAMIAKLREGAYDRRTRKIEQQLMDEEKIYNVLWGRMSAASQSKVREEPGFEEAATEQDCIRLWEFIRRTHLTHIYGVGDPLAEVNAKEQEIRYSQLQQGEKEYTSAFKTRFDNQIKANTGAGIVQPTESKVALDFIYKLDQKRFGKMKAFMHNNAICLTPDAYPPNLAAAFRIASGWVNEEPGRELNGTESHSAFVTDTAFVTKARHPKKGKLPTDKSSVTDKPSGKKSSSSLTIICYVCGIAGHYARNCTLKKDADETALITDKSLSFGEDEEEEYYDATNEGGYVTTTETVLFSADDVLLDSQASVNVFSNRSLLRNIRKSQNNVILNGVQSNIEGILIDQEGDFDEIGKVYFSGSSTANILSYAVMVDGGNHVSYDQENDRFLLRPAGGSRVLSFCRKKVAGSEGRFYCCNMKSMKTSSPTTYPVDSEHALVKTVSENMQRFSKREVDSARKATELLSRMGYPSIPQAIQICSTGKNFDTTAYDFEVAEAIWGKDLATIKGKTHKKPSAVADITLGTPIAHREQVLSVDIMFVEGVPSLIGLVFPLDLTLCKSLLEFDSLRPSRSAASVKLAIDSFIYTLASRNFSAKLIMSDGEGAIGKIAPDLNALGIEVDMSGAGGHVARIERRIQLIKERVRAHMAHKLPFTLNIVGISMLVLFCVSRINFQFSGTNTSSGSSPREIFSGRRVDGNLDFKVGFGEYVQATVPKTDSSMNSRTEDCITMLPTGNRTGSVKMLSLATGRIVCRDQFRVLPMPQSAIDRLNALAVKDGRKLIKQGGMTNSYTPAVQLTSPTDTPNPLTLSTDQTIVESTDPQLIGPFTSLNPDEASTPDFADESGIDIEENLDEGGIPTIELSPTDSEIVAGDLVQGPPHTVERNPPHTPLSPIPRSPAKQPTPTKQPTPVKPATILDIFRSGPSNYDMSRGAKGKEESVLVYNISVRDALRSHGELAETAMRLELEQMISKQVWRPIHMHQLTPNERSLVIRSKMFLKQKLHPDGSPDKFKARLVAGGDQQDKELYDDLSSPTVSTSAVLTVLSIAAYEHRSASVVDIGGAFLNAKMKTGIPVHMRMDQTISRILCDLAPYYMRYLDGRGCLVVLLDKALYGCVESAALWYENLCDTMKSLGYVKNQYEQCVFNKRNTYGVQCTAAVHVDDLLITSSDKTMIDHLCEGLKRRYGEITRCDGPKLNYLGMSLNLSIVGEVRITMHGYLEEILSHANTNGVAKTPATDGLFEIRPDAALVNEDKRSKFHTGVAMMSYLAKRAKPECLTAVAFLATRVTKCTEDDIEKLDRLIRYVRYSKDRGLVLRPGVRGIGVRIFIDAAYGVHGDGRSHTGSCVVIGDVGAVHCRSTKQTIVTKSSTEAELVALSDSANQGLYLRNFLISQGHTMGPVVIYQDNTSCMALAGRGRSGAERTRHIGIRYFWIKERVDAMEAMIEHRGTKEMYANLLTKPLQGAQFVYERECLTGW